MCKHVKEISLMFSFPTKCTLTKTLLLKGTSKKSFYSKNITCVNVAPCDTCGCKGLSSAQVEEKNGPVSHLIYNPSSDRSGRVNSTAGAVCQQY